MDYDYKNGKKQILEILNSKTDIEKNTEIPKNDDDFTYQNGIKSWVGAIFIDIVNSTKYFKDNNEEKIARIMRAFCSELIKILKGDSNYRQIGIRGDCVYAIYSTPQKTDLETIFCDAVIINTFIKMYKKILYDNNLPSFSVGIGLGCSQTLIIKAGLKGSGINDNIWIGDAVINASKLSSEAGRDGNSAICIDSTFYSNIKEFKANKDYTYEHYAEKKFSNKINEYVYYFELVRTNFNNWIDSGMEN